MKNSNEPQSPKTAEEQTSPQPERMVTPQEKAGEDLEELENPPQAEGPRERVEKDLENKSRKK
jgi:hypothetical protein